MKKIFLIIFLIFFLVSCKYDEYEKPEEVSITENDNIFEIYNKHTSNELIKDSNIEIISHDELLDTNSLGTKTYTIEYLYKKRKYKYDINYHVKDTTPPVFINASTNLTILQSENKTPCDKIVYGDNYDAEPTCEILGNYNLNNLGTYKDLEYIIKDSEGNTNNKKFTLNIVNKINNQSSTTQKKYLYINDILKTYKNDDTNIGIDVSKWQGNVNFEKVKNAGIEFVIMRIGSSNDPNSDITKDIRFEEYYQKAKAANLKIGIYVYNTSISPDDGIKTANWVINNLKDKEIDFPIAYDWENWSNYMQYKISMHTLSESYLAFEKTLKKAGYNTMLYSSKYYLENVWMNLENSKVWLAHYTDKTDYQGDYMLWQMTSLAKIDGITENTVDIDILYNKKMK